MTENSLSWNEDNYCVWEKKIIDEGVTTYLPKDKEI